MEKGNEIGADGAALGVAVGTMAGGTLVDSGYNPDDYYDPRLPPSDSNDPLSPIDPSVPDDYDPYDPDGSSNDIDPLAALPDDSYNPDDYYDPQLPPSDSNDPLSPIDPSVPDDYDPYDPDGSADDIDPLAALPDD